MAAIQTKLTDLNLNSYMIYRFPSSIENNNNKVNDLIRSIPKNSLLLGDLNHSSADWEQLATTKTFSRLNLEIFLGSTRLFQGMIVATPSITLNVLNRIFTVFKVANLQNSTLSIILMKMEGTVFTQCPKHSNFNLEIFKKKRIVLRDILWSKTLINDIELNWYVFK